jgi:DNA-binding NtrC family response regulator
VERGTFCPSLAAALARFEIELPPLRDRAEDIPALAEALVDRAAAALGRQGIRLSSLSLELLSTQPWPGNVAQLQQALERAVAFTRDREVPRRILEEVLADREESLASMRTRRESRDREALVSALRETGGNVTRAAGLLGRSRTSCYRMIAKCGIRLTRKG